MEFHVPNDSTLGFRGIHPLIAEFVRALPDTTDPTSLSQAAEGRLYPEPSTDPQLDEMRADWHAYVAPDLLAHFQSARDLVASDLRRMTEADELFEILIPRKNADAWLNVLNQARLVLATNAGLDDRSLDANEAPDLLSERGLTIFRINLYAFMQQCLVELLE